MCIIKMKRARRDRGILRQRGLSLIETAAVLGVAAIAMSSFATIMTDNTDQLKAKSVAEKMVEVQNAAKDYLKANNADLLAATATDPVVIPVGKIKPEDAPPAGPPGTPLPSLQGGGFLAPSFINKNGYNQQHAVIVKQSTLPTGERRLDALVTTFGGSLVPDRQLQRIAGYIGAAGGYVPRTRVSTADDDQIVGVQGGWRTPVDDWGDDPMRRPEQGSVVATMAYEVGTTLNDYLYRNNIGLPEANRMNTNIDMNSNDINRTRTIQGVGGTDRFGNTTTDVVSVSKDLKAQDGITAGIDIWAGRDVKATRNVEGQKFVDVNASGAPSLDANGAAYEVDPSNVSNVNDLRTVRLDLDTVVYGSSRGLTASQGIRLGDLLPKYVAHNFKIATAADPVVPHPTCGAGGVPNVILTPKNDSLRFNVDLDVDYSSGVKDLEGTLTSGLTATYETYVTDVRSTGEKSSVARQIWAEPGTNRWTVRMLGTPSDPAFPWQVQATTYCQYP